jgi:hypothetical protein
MSNPNDKGYGDELALTVLLLVVALLLVMF